MFVPSQEMVIAEDQLRRKRVALRRGLHCDGETTPSWAEIDARFVPHKIYHSIKQNKYAS